MTSRAPGAGPPLLLGPGIASTYQVDAPLTNRLAVRFHTVVFDYLGGHPDDGPTPRRVAHDDLMGRAATPTCSTH